MKLELRTIAACLILTAAVAGMPSCSSTTTDDSQTHFFSTCDSDAECGELECVCGRCTTRCSAGACSSGSVCAAGDSRPASDLCGLAAAPDVCLPECTGPSDCGSGTVCVEGTCTKEVATVPDCTIESLIDHVIGSPAGIVDCGTLETQPSASESAAASECAMTSAQNGADFRVVWARVGTDSLLRSAVVGAGGRTYGFHYDSMGFSETGATATNTAEWKTCDSLDATSACSPEEGLCITCEPDEVVHCACRLELGTTGPGTIHCK